MARGIIDGTHEIMRTFDASSAPPSAGSEASPTPQPASEGWTSKDTKVLSYVFGGIAGIVLMLFLVVPPVRRSMARKHVLENKDELVSRLVAAEITAKNLDVKEGTRKKLTKLIDEFSSVAQLTAASKKVKWVEADKQLGSTYYPLNILVADMEREVAFAEKARREGPELMKKIPGLIKAAEKKLAEGKPSPRAQKHIEEARTRYKDVQAQQRGMTATDWVVLYPLLASIQQSASSAESSYRYTNSDHSSRSSSGDSNSSYGYGGSSGFGGGGGFSDGGGGSSGSW